jgi:hypothetical protein
MTSGRRSVFALGALFILCIIFLACAIDVASAGPFGISRKVGIPFTHVGTTDSVEGWKALKPSGSCVDVKVGG